METKSNFDKVKDIIQTFFGEELGAIEIAPISLHEASKNDANPANITYFYNGKELQVLNMDEIAQKPYKKMRVIKQYEDTKNDIVNTADALVINKDNKWYMIEFKDTSISGSRDKLKHNILRKAYGNWYMLLDIMYGSDQEDNKAVFGYDNPIKFAKENVIYILVCNSKANPKVTEQIRNYRYKNQNYTPIFMQKLKEYLFADAYVYTEVELERYLVKRFEY